MKISVITVCLNSALTLQSSLESVAKQDWSAVEHIVIDGGSTDGTRDILYRSRSQLAYFVSEPDGGIYDAMNKGLAKATGDVICFLNADDRYASNKVLSTVAACMQENNLDALMGDVGFFRAGSFPHIVRRYSAEKFHPKRLAWGWMPAHPALFLRREVFHRVGRFKSDYRIAGDFEFIIRLFYSHRLHYQYLPKVVVYMQTGGASTSGLMAKVRLNQEVLRACRENGLQTNMLKILSKYPAKLLEIFYK